jgi:hypothetical protein
LYIASPYQFNDPIDCRITYNFDVLDTDEKILQYIEAFKKRKKNVKNERTENIDELMFNDIKNNKEDVQNSWNEHLFKMQDRDYGVLSLSEKWNSILMWGHYSLNHTGFCVGLYEEELKKSKLFGRGGLVTYTDSFPQINPIEDNTEEIGFIATHTKAIDWEYEREYRFFKLYDNKPSEIQDRVTELNKSAFAEINIGVKFPKEDIEAIRNIATELNIPLYQVKQIRNEFKLYREIINS